MVDCVICLTRMQPPIKVLSCGHSFCLPCICLLTARERRINGENANVVCPTCRNETVLPEGRVSMLPNNYALHEMLERPTDRIGNASSEESGVDEDQPRTSVSEIGNSYPHTTSSTTSPSINQNSSSQHSSEIPSSDRTSRIWNAQMSNHSAEFIFSDIDSFSTDESNDLSLDDTWYEVDGGTMTAIYDEDPMSSSELEAWRCPYEPCSYYNFGFRTCCRFCRTTRPLSSEVMAHIVDVVNDVIRDMYS